MRKRVVRGGLSRVGKLIVVCVTVAAVIAAGLVAVRIVAPSHPGRPLQPIWSTAAARVHRVPASATMARLVNGRLISAPARRATGRGATPPPAPAHPPAGSVPRGAVPPVTPVRHPRLPARGTARETTRVIAAPHPVRKTGYNPRTSRPLPRLASADQNVYANADGTRTAFEFQQPVNHRLPDGTWVPVNTTLVPVRATANGGGTWGWTEKSVAHPASFAGYADAPELVTLPVGRQQAIAFGVTGAGHEAGTAKGSEITYAGAMPGSDIRMTAGNGMVKENLVLHDAQAPATWTFPLTLSKGLRAESGKDGTIEFTDARGKVVGYVPHGFMTDSNINPRSGDGAFSDGITYSLVTAGGRPAIRMTLDQAWLRSSSRVFPVYVDPSVSAINSNGTTYVESPFSNDYSGDTEIKVGTWDGGANKAMSFLKFDGVSTQLRNDNVLGARLGVFNSWSYSCSPRPVYVYPVTSSWSVTGDKTYPGPSVGPSVGSASFATGWVPLGSTVSPCPASWEAFNLSQAGTDLVNGWTHGAANNGLALGASTSDSYGWKKFTSINNPTGDPFLAVTYTPDGAKYELASARPVKQVWPNANGQLAIRVTNTGAQTWTPTNGFELSYRAYNAAG